MTKVFMLTFNPFQENTYVVYETESQEAIIFDPGCLSQQEEQQLQAAIAERGLKPVKLINTHCHLDHVFGNRFVADTYELELGIHPLEQMLLERAPAIGQAYGIPPMKPSPAPAYFLEEGQQLQLGDATFDILLTPGHSPGSLCFYNAKEAYCIVGDVLFNGSIGRTDLPGGDYDALIGSILAKLLRLPNETIVYPGHGPSTTIGEERRSNPFLGNS